MPLTRIGFSAGTTSATLPAGTTTGDLVVSISFAAANGVPTLPASWVSVVTTATQSMLVAYRVYDGVWTMPTFTGASRVIVMTYRGQASNPIGVTSATVPAANTSIVWPAVTLVNSSGTSELLRAGNHNRTDVTLPVSVGHTLIDSNGNRPAFITQVLPTATSGATASSAGARSAAYSQVQVEILADSTTRVSATDATALSVDEVSYPLNYIPYDFLVYGSLQYDDPAQRDTILTTLQTIASSSPAITPKAAGGFAGGVNAKGTDTIEIALNVHGEAVIEALRGVWSDAWSSGSQDAGSGYITTVRADSH